jgi:hypothetical protein
VIPKILHRCAFGAVPEKYERFWAEWGELHPDWTLMDWNGPLIRDDWELGHQFLNVRSFSELADLVSIEVVWKYGGVYVDWDTEPLRPLDPITAAHDCFFGSEGGVWFSHGIFGATANHPAIGACMEAMATVTWDKDPNETTGPHLLTRVCRGRPDVDLLSKDLFYPINSDQYGPYTNATGEELAAKFPNAYTVHHWAHSWKDFKSGRMSAYNTDTLEGVLDV